MSRAPTIHNPALLLLSKALHLRATGQAHAAETLCRQALTMFPGHHGLANLLAVLCHETGNLSESLTLARAILESDHHNVPALMTLGHVLRRQDRHEQAAIPLALAVHLAPDNGAAHFELALCQDRNGDHALAETSYRRALTTLPDHGPARNNLGNLLMRRGALAEAEGCFREAIARHPGMAAAHFNLANLMRLQDAPESAIRAYRRALAAQPDHLPALINLAEAHRDLGQLDKAEAALRHALALAPDHPEAHFNLSQILLLRGRFTEGWREYEWRLKAGQAHRPPFAQPRWCGENAAGRWLLIHAEQGLGDTIQMLRFLPQIRSRGVRIILETPPALTRLCRQGNLADKVIALGDPLPPFDLHLPIMSLPSLLADHGPVAAPPYLAADPAEIREWQERLGTIPEAKIGVVWAGSPTHADDHRRSISAATLLSAVRHDDLHLFALQKAPRATDRSFLAAADMAVTDLSAALTDLAATAAIITALDLVVAVDTSTAHLAAALGKPVWLLLPFAPDWRWRSDEDGTPWYPTMRLFRQRRPGDWESVLSAVSAAARDFVHARQGATTIPTIPGDWGEK